MQQFVEEYIARQKALLGESCATLDEEHALAARRAREERLIRLGMCRREYSDSTSYNEAYPYQEYKTGRYYRDVAFEVTDEEYEAICLYDNRTAALVPKKGITHRLFGNTAKKLRRLAFPFAVGILLVGFALAAVLYLTEESFIFLAVGAALAGIGAAFAGGLTFYALGEILSRLDHMSVETVGSHKED